MQEKIFQMLLKEDEVTWQSLIYNLVKNEGMNPWDVDISKLTQKYIETVKEMKVHNFRVSGKMLLAAAMLLKIKSNKLLGEDLSDLDRLIAGPDMSDEGFYEDLENFSGNKLSPDDAPPLMPRTPQPRLRKVSIYDLVGALQQALEVKKRRLWRNPPVHMNAPERKIDLSALMDRLYNRITNHFDENKGTLTFTQLLPSESKQDKIHTFLPLLHLTTHRKIDIFQTEHFGEIEITMPLAPDDPRLQIVKNFKETLEGKEKNKHTKKIKKHKKIKTESKTEVAGEAPAKTEASKVESAEAEALENLVPEQLIEQKEEAGESEESKLEPEIKP